jgi:hypothetical protein
MKNQEASSSVFRESQACGIARGHLTDRIEVSRCGLVPLMKRICRRWGNYETHEASKTTHACEVQGQPQHDQRAGFLSGA